MIDCLIHGGSVIDGTGSARRRADIGIDGGRVVAVGQLDEVARSRLDASGLVVTPGFIDLHTHYDAQLFWDPLASPVVSPRRHYDHRRQLRLRHRAAAGGSWRLLDAHARAGGGCAPREPREPGSAWDWTSFEDWLGRMQGRLAVNAGFLAGHSTLRRLVMGEAAVGEAASQAQISEMTRLLHERSRAGRARLLFVARADPSRR